MENPIKMDDLGVPLFLETPIYNPRLQDNCQLFTASLMTFPNFAAYMFNFCSLRIQGLMVYIDLHLLQKSSKGR